MTQSLEPPQSDSTVGDSKSGPYSGSKTFGASNDRRRKRRALISAPVRIRCLDTTPGGPDEICTTVDVSRNGILFVSSNHAFYRGMEVAVTFPYTKFPSIPAPEQPGSVVRISTLSEEGKLAIAIGFGTNEYATNIARLVSTQKSERIMASLADEGRCRKPLILVVEADVGLRNSLKDYLSGEGYKVIALDNASDGREVLNMLTPVLLIAEIEGEGLPGFDLCVHVKTTPRLKHIPVMLTTESAYPSDYSSAHSLGAVVCLAKPFRQERLGHVVRLLAPPRQVDAHAAPPQTTNAAHRRKTTTNSCRADFGKLRFP